MKVKKPPRSPLKTDPSRTATLRRAFAASLLKRFNELKREITKFVAEEDNFGLKLSSHDPFTANTAFKFHTTTQQLNAFQSWLKQKVSILLLAGGENSWWRKYIIDGFRKGQGRVFDDYKQKNPDLSPQQAQFLKQAFNNPVSDDRVNVLASRVLTELKGVTEAMAQGIMRELTDGLTQGLNPKTIAKNINQKVDGIGAKRAKLIAHTEIVRSHSEGQLDELERMGVKEVGVQVEFSAAHDNRVCPICKGLDGKKYTIEKARGVIPVHPLCRCAFRPILPTDLLDDPDEGGESKDKGEPKTTLPQRKKSMWGSLKSWIVGNRENRELDDLDKLFDVISGSK